MDANDLFEQPSPDGNINAVVEQDERCAYFYLFGPKDSFGMRPCWVRNIAPAPQDPDVVSMQEGRAPILHAGCCSHPQGSKPLEAEDLRIVWFEEGDAAALFERDQLLAVIPGWAGSEGFNGYARDCTAENDLVWPLPAGDSLLGAIRNAEEYWAEWDAGLWKRIQPRLLATTRRFIGQEAKYFAIDGGKWPPKALVKISRPEATFLLTIGVSLRAQPTVDQHVKTPALYRRAELAMALAPEISDEVVMQSARHMNTLSCLPWNEFTWLGHGHTVECDCADFGRGPKFSAVLLNGQPAGVPEILFEPFRGDPINVLWLMPVTAKERSFAESHQSKPLLDKLARMGVTGICRPRPEATGL